MKIILRTDFESLGKAGDIVTVKDGYARNYLIPKGIALQATPQNLRRIEEEKKRELHRQLKQRETFEALANELEKLSLTIAVAVGEEDKVFGSVTSQDIADLLKEKGFDIDKRKIVLEDPIKALGVYDVPIHLYGDLQVKVRLWVVKQ